MKTLVYLIFLFLLLSFSNKQVDKPKGKIKSYRETIYSITNPANIDQTVFQSNALRTFDLSGKIKEEILYSSKGEIMHKATFEYDDNGNTLEADDVKKNPRDIYTYSNDSKGNKIERIRSQSGTVLTKKYDYKGRKIEHSVTNSKGETLLKFLYVYDNQGRKIEDLIENSKGEAGGILYFYDEIGNKIETKTYSKRPEGNSRSKFKYDKSGNIVEQLSYNGSGDLRIRNTFEYDNHGNKIETKWYDSTSKLMHYQKFVYKEFDNAGNWLKADNYYDGTIRNIHERKIEYY